MLESKNMLYLLNKTTAELQEAETRIKSLEFELDDANREIEKLMNWLEDSNPEAADIQKRGTLPLKMTRFSAKDFIPENHISELTTHIDKYEGEINPVGISLSGGVIPSDNPIKLTGIKSGDVPSFITEIKEGLLGEANLNQGGGEIKTV